jgi:hypothetical protein
MKKSYQVKVGWSKDDITTFDFNSYVDALNKYYELCDYHHELEVKVALLKDNKIIAENEAIDPIAEEYYSRILREDNNEPRSL